jgi:error-prone DNA polymerase
MGFYAPAQIIQDAIKHGVLVLPIDVNYSMYDNTMECVPAKRHALRLGYRQIKGIGVNDTMPLEKVRSKQFKTINDVFDAGVSQSVLEKLASADAFRSLGIDRRQALWEVTALADHPVGIFTGQPTESEAENVQLPEMTTSEHVVQDYAAISLSLKAHPLTFLRGKLSLLAIVTAQQLSAIADGAPVKVAGLVLVRQRPSTSKGVLFMTLEDETGTVNLVVFNHLFEKHRKEIMHSKLIMVEGTLQRQGEVVHVILENCHDFTKLLGHLTSSGQTNIRLLTPSRPDEKTTAPIPIKARNFK